MSRTGLRSAKRWLRFALVAATAAFPAVSTALAAPPALADLLRPTEHENVILSPDGRFLAVTLRAPEHGQNRVVLVIVDRDTRQPVRLLDPGEKSEVDRAWWANNERLFLMNTWGGDHIHQYYLDPSVISVDVAGKRKRAFLSTIVDTLIDDDEHILVAFCGKQTTRGCHAYVQKADNDGKPVGERLAESPDINASFFSDNAGTVLFAYAWDDSGHQKLWSRKQGQWRLFNDEAVSNVEVLPIGVSRDGGSVFLRSERVEGPDVIERFDIATAARTVVLSDPELDPAYILWSMDGRQPIGAAYGRGVPRARFWDSADPDAIALQRLQAAFPGDAVSFQSGTRDGSRAIVSVWNDREPGSFHLFDRASGRTELIARMKPWLDPAALAKTQPIAFVNREGVALDGYLTMPVGGSATPPPLVVMPHGGPFEVSDVWRYDEEVQLLATHGYAVLRVNFRGSGGRGRAFERAGYRQWGTKIQDDITDGVRWAIENGGIDPSRICIWGTSFGGYAALMGAAREPGLYRCAISTAGPTDLNISRRWGDTHQSRYGRNYLDEAVGDDRDRLHAQSPVAHVDRIAANVLLVHGEHDERVSFEHARAMQAAMERAGKTPETLFLQQETHGVHGEKNRLLYYGRVLDFLDANLGTR